QKGHEVWSIGVEATVYTALKQMKTKNVGALVVVDDSDQMIGIFSERDAVRKGILEGKDSRDTLVRDLMTSPVIAISPENSLDECMVIMSEKHIRHLPVQTDGKLVGVVTIRDVVKNIIRNQRNTINELETYIRGGGYGLFG
ncbi:MAG: CBS domain-containing protein, partial [Bacteroidota bacterium]